MGPSGAPRIASSVAIVASIDIAVDAACAPQRESASLNVWRDAQAICDGAASVSPCASRTSCT